MTKNELIERMKNAKTWREAGLTVQDVMSVITQEEKTNFTAEKIQDQNDTFAEYQKTIANLRESIKKLRSENKRLREANK